jgi:hypothetical protein
VRYDIYIYIYIYIIRRLKVNEVHRKEITFIHFVLINLKNNQLYILFNVTNSCSCFFAYSVQTSTYQLTSTINKQGESKFVKDAF